MRRLLTGALLVLAGCGDGGGEPRRTTQMKPSSEYVDKLKALTPINQGLALRRAIQDAKQRCKKVEAASYQEDYKNLSMWTARCSDTGEWALFIAPNADVQVRACKDLATLKLPVCRSPATPPPR